MKDNLVENQYCELWVEDDVIHQYFKPSLKKLNIEIAKVLSEDLRSVINSADKPLPILVEINNAYFMDIPAGRFFAKDKNILRLRAIAVLINNPVALLGAKLFVSINKPKIKIDFFSDKAKAIEWLSKFKLQ